MWLREGPSTLRPRAAPSLANWPRGNSSSKGVEEHRLRGPVLDSVAQRSDPASLGAWLTWLPFFHSFFPGQELLLLLQTLQPLWTKKDMVKVRSIGSGNSPTLINRKAANRACQSKP